MFDWIKRDWWHEFTTLADHNRYVTAGAALTATMFLGACLPGFDGKTTSPFDGTSVTGEQLEAQADAALASLQARADALAADLIRIEAESVALESESAALNENFQAAAERIAAEKTALLGALETAKNAIASYVPGSEAVLGTIWTLGVSALGLGVVADNRRKDRLLRQKS